MPSENHGNVPPLQTVPVYTLYPGSYHESPGYGFHHNHPQESPPKYEDVISGNSNAGRLPQQPPVTYGGPEQAVVFVAPVKYSSTQRAFGIIFTILFLVGFLSVLIKVLSVR